jgi:hypothetical protein
MNPAEVRTLVGEELRGIHESLDLVGASVEDTLVALEEAQAGGRGVPPAVRAQANEILMLLKGSVFYVPVADKLNQLLLLLARD